MSTQITSLSQTVKEKLIDPALDASDKDALEKATMIWRCVTEAEKAEVEMAAVIRSARSENLRYWIPILAPTITAVALVSTLVFQVQQFKVNSQLQRQINEDSQWRDALTHAKSSDGKQNAIALTIIRSFFDSPRYSKEAREVAEVLMFDTSHPAIFQRHLEDLVRRTDWDSYQTVVNISRSLLRSYLRENELIQRVEAEAEQNNTIQSQTELNDLYDRVNNFDELLGITSTGLAWFLRNATHPPPSHVTLDLSNSALWMQDVSNMNFRRAQLSRISISNCNLNAADLRGATLGNSSTFYNSNVKDADFGDIRVEFDSNSETKEHNWAQTAWWRAKSISPELLRYLRTNFEFSSKVTYRDDSTKDFAEYQKEVERLIKNK